MRGQHEARVVGAGGHAAAAADAALVALQHEAAVFHHEGGFHRAVAHARWVFAVVAQARQELARDVRVFAGDLVGHPGAVDAQGRVVLGLAGDLAGHAADAAAGVDDHGVPLLGGFASRRRGRGACCFTHRCVSWDGVGVLVSGVSCSFFCATRVPPPTWWVFGAFFPLETRYGAARAAGPVVTKTKRG